MASKLFIGAVGLVVGLGWAAPALAQPAGGAPAPTFNKDVAPIFYENCTSCHRPGDIAPMSLMSYKDARPWARSIAAHVTNGTMPPWHADPAHGDFVNARRLTDAQKATIAAWVSAGAPEGRPGDLPAPPRYVDGWTIGQPDVVLSMQEDYPIPAKGTIPYVYFEVPANFAEDRWIQAWELRPGNRAVVHHVIVNLRPAQTAPAPASGPTSGAPAASAPRPLPVLSFADGMNIPPGQTGGPPLPEGQRTPPGPGDRPRPRGTAQSIGGYVPGNGMRVFPEGTAMRLPAGSSLVFQMHYTPMGEETTDRTRMGLIFAKSAPKIALNSAALVNGSLHIPAGAADHRVDAEMTINRDILLFSMVPHTHVRGKRWLYEVTYPDGRRETILSVPNYDFDWQHEYQFREPLKLPSGTKLHASAWYDNSPANKSNPDATKDVWWGDQTWEEMMFTGLTFSVIAPPPSTARPQQ
jgi:mono/diheme cytochrome c family protein